MLSRLSTRASSKILRLPQLSFVRFESDDLMGHTICEKDTVKETVKVDNISKVVASEVTDFVPRPVPYNSPLRDHVNFPTPVHKDNPSPTRLGFIPDEWFRFFYPKLGVTGPYTLGIGFLLMLVQKELYLINDAEFKHTLAFFLWVYVFVKTPLGEKIRQFLIDRSMETQFINFRKYNEELRLEAIEHEKKEQWRQEGKQLLFDAKKENVGLQLEAVYRESVMDFYKQVKRRLDYQVEVAKIDSRIKHQFMVKWVIDRVNESVAKMSEKENLKQCIANLNAIAAATA